MQRRVILIYGQTGSGKTTFARRLLAQASRALVVDADFGEFQGQEFADYSEMVDALEAMRAFGSRVPFRVSYSPYDDEHALMFDLAVSLGNVELFLEEGDRFDYLFEYQRVVIRGRHYGVSVVAVGLNWAVLPKALRRQATRVVAFAQTDPDDIHELARQVGPLAYDMGPDEQGRLRHPPFSYLDWTPRGGARIFGPDGKPLTAAPPACYIPRDAAPGPASESKEPTDSEATQ